MVINLSEIFGVLRPWMAEIVIVLVSLILLQYSKSKIREKRIKTEEFRGWLLVEVLMIVWLPIYLLAISKLLELWIGYKILLAAIVTLTITLPYSIYFLLAPNNCYWTFVREGTAKFVVKGDEFHKCLIQWKGYTFDYKKDHPEKWDVIEGKERHLFGGLRYYGFWPLFDIHIYEFRWGGVAEDGKEQFKKEWIDYILLKDDVYLCKISRAEDKNRLPLDFQVFLTIRVINPYKAKFAIQRWLETVLNRIQPLIRQHIAQYSYEELLKMRHGLGEEMRKKLEDEEVLKEFKDRYGVEVRAIEVREIEPPAEVKEATLKQRKAEYEAMAMIALAEGEKTATIKKAEGEAERILKTFSQVREFGENGFLLKIAEEAKGKDVPALVLTHHLTTRFEKLLEKPEITKEDLKKIIEELARMEEVVKKLQGR